MMVAEGLECQYECQYVRVCPEIPCGPWDREDDLGDMPVELEGPEAEAS